MGRFHAARAEVRKHIARGSGDVFVPLANWTVACRKEQGSKGGPHCSEQSRAKCAAVAGNSRAVPSHCLRVRRAPGASLRLRQSDVLADTRAARWIEEGERLFREFVRRHGLYSAVWASAQPQLAPPKMDASLEDVDVQGESGACQGPVRNLTLGIFGDRKRESLFSVLQSLQDEFLVEATGGKWK